MNVQKSASLHEKAVQSVARGEHGVPRARRTRGAAKSSRVASSHMLDGLNEQVRLEVERLDVDLRRVQVLETGEAVIWNHAAPWPGAKG